MRINNKEFRSIGSISLNTTKFIPIKNKRLITDLNSCKSIFDLIVYSEEIFRGNK